MSDSSSMDVNDVDNWHHVHRGWGPFVSDSDSDDLAPISSGNASVDSFGIYSDDEAVDEEDSGSEGHGEGDGEKVGVPMTERWRFLRGWFKVLRRRVSMADPWRYDTEDVRLGREPDDWRIEVDIELHDDNETEEAELLRLRSMREALILTSMLAEVDYDVWISEFRRTSRFKPMPFMDLKSHQLQRKFSILVYGNYAPEAMKWQFLQEIFGVERYSAQFSTDLAKMAKQAAEEGVNVYKMEPLSLVFQAQSCNYTTYSRTHQLNVLRDIHETALHLRDLEAAHRQKQRSLRYKGVPVFRLDGLDMNYRYFNVHPTFFHSLRKLIEVGVPVTALTLPQRVVEGEDKNEDALFSSWVALARTVTGHSPRPSQVNRLILPAWYCNDQYLASFCSALPTARGLEFLRLESNDVLRDELSARLQSWAWLGCGIFHPLSMTSVETLCLKGFRLREQHLDTLKSSFEIKSDSLGYMWRGGARDLSPNEEMPSRREVVIMKDTTLQLMSESNNRRSIVTTESVRAIVMADDDEGASQPLDVLIPGFGFCRVDQKSLQKKKQRRGVNVVEVKSLPAPSRSGLTSLLLEIQAEPAHNEETSDQNDENEEEAEDETIGNGVSQLLALVGNSLTSLSIENAMSGKSLTAALENCPQLKNLRLGHIKLKSMDPLVQFHAQGRRLSSLELRQFTVPIELFDSFLLAIAEDQDDVYRLERLSIGHGWSRTFLTTTAEALTQLLEDNKRLTHLHLLKSRTWNHESRAFRSRDFIDFRGDAVSTPLDVSRRLAFLSVLRPENLPSRHQPRSQVSDYLVRNVLELAAFAGKRIVIAEMSSFARLDRYD